MTDWIKRGEAITPCGSQTRSKSWVNFPGLKNPYVIKAEGAKLTLVDGTEMVDLVCGMGASILGYGHPRFNQWMRTQAYGGSVFGLPHINEIEVSEKFVGSLPMGESVRWLKTGSEACSAAMRVARRATGREIIITSDQSYHGWHDGFTAVKPDHSGVPECITETIVKFKYNDIDSLSTHLDINKGKVAAVMMEPCLYESPKIGFLEGVKKLAHKAGALFILDEMILGARLAWGGGQEYFGVTSDLACYGKAIAGGFPLACVVGSRELMKYADVVSGTFGGDALSLAALDCVISLYSDGSTIETLHDKGGKLLGIMHRGINNLPAEIQGRTTVFRIQWSLEHADKLRTLWTKWLIKGGVLAHPFVTFSSFGLTESDIFQIEVACSIAGDACREALRNNDWSELGDNLIESLNVR